MYCNLTNTKTHVMWIREIKIVTNGCEHWDGCFLLGLKNHSIKSACLHAFITGKSSLFKDSKLFEPGMFSNIGAKEERTSTTANLNMYSWKYTIYLKYYYKTHPDDIFILCSNCHRKLLKEIYIKSSNVTDRWWVKYFRESSFRQRKIRRTKQAPRN